MESFPKKTHDTNVDISNDKHFPKGSSRMAWHCLNVLYFDSFMRFSIWWLHTLNYNGESIESFIWTKNSVIHAMKTGALQLPVLHVIKTSHHCAFHKFSWLCNQYPGIPWKNNEFPRVTTFCSKIALHKSHAAITWAGPWSAKINFLISGPKSPFTHI